MPFKSNVQPLCRCCGKPVAKYTTVVWFGQSAARMDHFSASKTECPVTREDAQRLVNQTVVSVRYSDAEKEYRMSSKKDQPPRFVKQVSVWDGESYKDQFFCSDRCAVEMAYAFARAGHSCVAYANAVEGKAA